MADNRVERRLAAILAADVAGYSRLMGADEEGVLARLKAARKSLVEPTVAAHRGRIVKTTGDGMLVEFASAVDAARCAIEVQRGLAEQNAAVPEIRPRNAFAARCFEKLCIAMRSAVGASPESNGCIKRAFVDGSVISSVAYMRFWRRFINTIEGRATFD